MKNSLADASGQLDAAAQALFQSAPRVSPLWSLRRISEGQDRRKACKALRERSPAGMRSMMDGPGVIPALRALAVSTGAVAGGATGTGGRGVAGMGRDAVSPPRGGRVGAGPPAPGGITPPAQAESSNAAASVPPDCRRLMPPRRSR